MPRSIASIAFDSGAGLRMKLGELPVSRLRGGLGVGCAHQVGVEEAEVRAADVHAAGRESPRAARRVSASTPDLAAV